MSIRLRTVNGVRVALCAAETDEASGDTYLDDDDHYALAAKFAHDWQGHEVDWQYPEQWRTMATQKLRDAREELAKWSAEQGRLHNAIAGESGTTSLNTSLPNLPSSPSTNHMAERK